MTNWASGKRSPSMPMNGIVPPSPKARAGWPNAAAEAPRQRAPASHGANDGAFQPGAASAFEGDACAVRRVGGERGADGLERHAPDRTSVGSRTDSCSAVDGRSTLPASAGRGQAVGADRR